MKHGLSNHKLYEAFTSMKQRCYNQKNPAYIDYGERGIKICDEWLDKENGFITFYNWALENGYEEHLTIDRKDVNGNYEPSNCRWITNLQQQNNKRNSVKITIDGESKTIAEWSRSSNLSVGADDMSLYIKYPRLYAICTTYKITKERIDKWVSVIKHDKNCIDHGFDNFDIIQVGIRQTLVRLEHYSELWGKKFEMDFCFNDVDADVFNKSYDYQHGYFGYLVGWRYAVILRAMIMSEINQ